MTLARLLWLLGLTRLGDRCARASTARRDHAYGGRSWLGDTPGDPDEPY